ncbi:MAG: hypothetical protein LBD11_08980 [Candidatus Peribacteria bacterium]|jgi:hypothetical protein|nr:hypothetical protein [Candidatus Peribacteria bacterium]
MLRQKFAQDDLKGLFESAKSSHFSTPKEVVKQWKSTYFIGEEATPYLGELVDFVKKAKKGLSLEEILN